MLAFSFISAVAFQGPAVPARSSSIQMMAKSKALPFLEAPPALEADCAGNQGFDPLKCTEYVDLKWLSEAERKHGRICMLATVGYIATDLGLRFPGEAYASVASSAVAHDAMVTKGDMFVLFLVASVFEIFGGVPKVIQMYSYPEVSPPAGNFGFDPLGLGKGASAERMEVAEVKHCRLAMLAFSGIVTQSVLYDKGFPYF